MYSKMCWKKYFGLQNWCCLFFVQRSLKDALQLSKCWSASECVHFASLRIYILLLDKYWTDNGMTKKRKHWRTYRNACIYLYMMQNSSQCVAWQVKHNILCVLFTGTGTFEADGHMKPALSSKTHRSQWKRLKLSSSGPMFLPSLTSATFSLSEKLQLKEGPRWSLTPMREIWKFITITLSPSRHTIWYSFSSCAN